MQNDIEHEITVMDSSSEDSFTWTKATDESSNSGDITMKHVNKNQHDEYSDSDKAYKKKLQNELFNDNESEPTIDTEIEQKYKKRKLKQQPDGSEDNESPKKKRIKIEPECDTDFIKKKKKKNKGNDVSRISSIDTDDENYLKSRVKQELTNGDNTPLKLSKQHDTMCSSNNQDEYEDLPNVSKKNKKKKNNCDFNNSVNSEIVGGDSYDRNDSVASVDSSLKKKKKKRKRETENSENETTVNINIQEDETIEDPDSTDIQMEGTSIKKKLTQHEEKSQLDSPKKNDKTKHKSNGTSHNHTMNGCDYGTDDENNLNDHRESETIAESKQNKSFVNVAPPIKKNTQQTLRIPDRIRFEDDDSENEAYKSKENSTSHSTKFKYFLSENDKLKPVSEKISTNSIITNDDDIWIVKCPYEVDINSLTNKEIVLDSKCKIKMGGDIYYGTVDNEMNRVTIMSLDHNNYVINNLTLNGVVNFRKRIPKLHLQDDIAITKNQTTFIPLPETKCRHPLFGSDFKKALKLPPSVVQKLKENETEYLSNHSEKGKKKKHKKLKEHVKEELDENVTIKADVEIEMPRKKSKKRKHTDTDGPSAKRAKTTMHDPESADAWKSNEAIEETLFNF